MSVLQIAHHRANFRGETLPSFPALVEVTAQLGPAELFGEADLSGKLRLSPIGKPVTLDADRIHGGLRKHRGQRLPIPAVETVLFDLPLSIEGRNATVAAEVSSEEAFRRCIGLMANFLPSFLAVSLGAPVELEDLFGTVDGQYFQIEVAGAYQWVVQVAPTERAIDTYMRTLQVIPAAQSSRLFLAFRYMNQQHWLEYLALHPTQFAPERLLSLAKALEVLLTFRARVASKNYAGL